MNSPASQSPPLRPFRVALTGGIASGKTTVANLFAAHGVPLIDTDVIAREVVEPGEPALELVTAAFGPEVLGLDGRLDRRQLRERIFQDPSARRTLESIMHPAIRAQMELQARAAANTAPYQLLVIPLLAEGGRRDHVERVLVVDAPEDVQVARLVARDHVTEAQARAALHAQVGRADRLALADDVIVNTGAPHDLEAQVGLLHQRYLEMADRKGTGEALRPD